MPKPPPPPAERQRKVVVVLGAPGQGKTNSVLVPMTRQYAALHGPDALVGLDQSGDLEEAMPELAPRFEWPGKDGVKDWWSELTADGQGPAGGGFSGLVVLPDADRYMTPYLANTFADLCLANRHLGLDAIIDGHRPQRFPKDLFEACSELWLFAISEPHALDYLSSVKGLGRVVRYHTRLERELDAGKRLDVIEQMTAERVPPLPTEPGQALRCFPRTGEVHPVRTFPDAPHKAKSRRR